MPRFAAVDVPKDVYVTRARMYVYPVDALGLNYIQPFYEGADNAAANDDEVAPVGMARDEIRDAVALGRLLVDQLQAALLQQGADVVDRGAPAPRARVHDKEGTFWAGLLQRETQASMGLGSGAACWQCEEDVGDRRTNGRAGGKS